ncbi:hypothetical protein [Flavihumibacter sp. UBA7668]|uniref:hypothetical protein n=1 Tax=Flavihumibacter sp. UBA7668 TaxID=1946542 RepID=UPI0025C68186|nr:hypothetical protein [Flavihumibacter sp. UBA7668]
MKVRISHLFIILIGFCFTNCSKTEDNPDGPTGRGIVQPQGTNIGTALEFIVTSAGGTFKTADDKLELIFPADAVTQATRIAIQPITNTNPAGVGNSFQLSSPNELLKPVKIRMSYKEYADSLPGGSCALGISYQDSSGVWQLLLGRSLNAANEYVEISTATLSSFCLMQAVRLIPSYSEIAPSQTVELKAVSNILLPDDIDICDLWDVLQGGTIPVEGDFPIKEARIEKWSVAASGETIGTLSPNGARAVYKASQYQLPAINPVTIMLELKATTKPFFAKVFVVPSVRGLSILIRDKLYVFSDDQVYVSVSGSNEVSIQWESNQGMGGLNIQFNRVNSYGWNDPSGKNDFWFEPSDFSPLSVFQHLWDDGRSISSGSVRISKTGTVGQPIIGSIIIDRAGRTNTESGNGEYLGDTEILGSFNLMRDE